MKFKKTLAGIIAIPLALTLAYSSANYANSKMQGREAPLVAVPKLFEMDPVLLAGCAAGLYSAYKRQEERK